MQSGERVSRLFRLAEISMGGGKLHTCDINSLLQLGLLLVKGRAVCLRAGTGVRNRTACCRSGSLYHAARCQDQYTDSESDHQPFLHVVFPFFFVVRQISVQREASLSRVYLRGSLLHIR